MEIWLVFIGEKHVCSGSDFATVFREVGCISVECNDHVTFMVYDRSVGMSCYLVKELVKCIEG